MAPQAGCRLCQSTPLSPILSLGRMPLANALLDGAASSGPEPAYPLDLRLCPVCTLLQIDQQATPEALFGNTSIFPPTRPRCSIMRATLRRS